MKALRLVMLWALTIFSSQLWGYSSTTELTYRYDAFDSYFFSLNTQPETQNRNYDENSNFRYSGRKYIDSYYQKKTQSGSFFVFEVGFVATKGGSVGAMRRNTFEASPKHGTSARSTSKGVASRGPTDGQHALDVSVQVRGTSPTRVGVDKANGEIVVFNRTSEGIFHGHVRSFGELNNRMKSALIKSGMVDRKGSFK